MQELVGKPYKYTNKDGIEKGKGSKEAKVTTLPPMVDAFLTQENVGSGSSWVNNFFHPRKRSSKCNELRNSPHVDMQSDTDTIHNNSNMLDFGHRHPPGPREFFRMHGSHSSFVDAVGMDVQMLELIKVDESEGTFEIKFELTVSWCT